MDSTPNLLLPYILPSQAQKSVTHNEALKALDALVMPSVKSRTGSTPPTDPADGERHIVATGADGAWAGQEGSIAAMQDGAWLFYRPAEGWLVWCEAEGSLLCFSEGLWVATGASARGFQNIALLGVNATADQTNRLAVAADATLLSHDGADHRLIVNKKTEADTASLLFQHGFSGRAEIGLAGDNRLRVKVSSDGSSFSEAIEIDPATARVSFPRTNLLQGYAMNLYQDSGRMAGNGAASQSVGAFDWPAYFLLGNGATAAAQGKFIQNNGDYGGSGGALESNVKALIDRIKDPGYRRYGVEFWIAAITAGSGTSSSPLTVGSESGHYSLINALLIRPPALTFHVYLRALDDTVLIKVEEGQTFYKDGVPYTAAFAVTPGEDWVSITVHDEADPRKTTGYQPNFFNVYCKAGGDRYLIACPALMGGITEVDDNIGVVVTYNSWLA